MDYFYEPLLHPESKSITLKGNEAMHILKVLRYSAGAALTLLDGRGGVYDGVISGTSHNELEIKISQSIIKSPSDSRLNLGLGLIKKTERIEWFIEKAIEIGISEINIFYSANSEKKKFNMERMQKIAVAAMKQSGNPWLPVINGPVSFGSLIKTNFQGAKYIGYCGSEKEIHLAKSYKKGTDAFILIGPEGDFTREEVILAEKEGFNKISLGDNRLRSETAALASLMIVDTINNR